MDTIEINDVSMFTEQVGSRFRIEIDTDRFVTAELVEASALNAGPRSADLPPREPFSLLFQVEQGIELPQQTYRIHHESLGELMLFLTPVGAGRLESVFN